MVSSTNKGLAKWLNRRRCSASDLDIIPLSKAFFMLIALVGNPDIMDSNTINTALLLMLNSFDIMFISFLGIYSVKL